MAQINLLKQKTIGADVGEALPGIFAKVLILVLLAVGGYYAWLYFQVKSVNSEEIRVEQKIEENKAQMAKQKEKGELITRQQQLKQLDTLITNHLYWSQLLPALARVTLKQAGYTSLKVTPDGNLALTATVPTLEDLDKYMQVFDIPDVYQNFSDLVIESYSKIPDGEKTSVNFNVRLKYNPDLLRYKGPSIINN